MKQLLQLPQYPGASAQWFLHPLETSLLISYLPEDNHPCLSSPQGQHTQCHSKALLLRGAAPLKLYFIYFHSIYHHLSMRFVSDNFYCLIIFWNYIVICEFCIYLSHDVLPHFLSRQFTSFVFWDISVISFTNIVTLHPSVSLNWHVSCYHDTLKVYAADISMLKDARQVGQQIYVASYGPMPVGDSKCWWAGLCHMHV